jgi:azurin
MRRLCAGTKTRDAPRRETGIVIIRKDSMTRYLTISALVLAVAAAGCSAPAATDPSATPASAAGSAAPATARAAAPANAVHDGRAFQISGNDTMKFSVTEITAKRGEKLSVTLSNNGTTPKFSMGHNWVLLIAGADLQAFAVAAAEAVTTDYVPAGNAQVLAATKLLGPNESATVTFTAPATPGRYEFLCSFPGHFQVGMRGVLIVE